jgi:CoA:oxalate CoA-transferase
MNQSLQQGKQGALTGIKVLDFTLYTSGPAATQILADMGAEVIKVEHPHRHVGAGPFVEYLDKSRPHFHPYGERLYDLCYNRGKKSITLNLKSPEERAMAYRLAERADIVIENFKPGTIEKMGLGYEDVRKGNPTVIYTSISGFGQTGPYKYKGAFDMVIQGMSGMMSLTGSPEGEPTVIGSSAADILTGIQAVVATLAALHYRDRTGKGQYVDVAMLDSFMPMLDYQVSNHLYTGKNPRRNGNRNPSNAPFETFKASDGTVIIAAHRDMLFKRFCNVVGHTELLEDPRFASPSLRVDNRDALAEIINGIIGKQTVDYWVELLESGGVPVGVVNNISDVCAHPQVAARKMVVEVYNPNIGYFKQMGTPYKMSESPASAMAYAEETGASNYDVFGGILGMSRQEIEALLEKQKKARLGGDES